MIFQNYKRQTVIFSKLILSFIIVMFSTNYAFGQDILGGLPALNVNTEGNKTQYSLPLQILILMTALTILPSLV